MAASTRRLFPDGLRVLVVNYNPAWLNDIEATLTRCKYQGTVFCGSYEEALDLLKEKRHDVVLCGLNNLNNGGVEELEFLERVAGELHLPVTCAISNEEDAEAMVKKYARYTVDIVVGPATEKDLKAIWQHAYRKMLLKASAANNNNNTALAVVEEDQSSNDEPIITATATCNNSQEKQKLIWTEELHREFVGALERTGAPLDKVSPKKILKEMNISPGITRDQVSSHLQKYRKRVKDEEEAARKNNLATAAASTSSAPRPPTHHEYDAPINGQQHQIVANQDCTQQFMNQYDPQVDQESARLRDCAPPPSLHLPDQVVNQESALHLDCAQQIMNRHPQAVNQESAHRSDYAPQMVELDYPQVFDPDQLLAHLPDLDDEEIAHRFDDAQQMMMDLPQLINQESIRCLGCGQETMHLSDLVDQESARCFNCAQQMRDLPQLVDQGSIRCLGCAQQITHLPYLVDQDGSFCFSCAQQIIMRCPPQEVNNGQESANKSS